MGSAPSRWIGSASPWPRRPGPPADERVTPSIPRRATRWVLTLLAVVPACAPADGRRASTVTVDTLAGGVVRVRNADPGPWSDAETWRIVEDLRISSDDPADPATFSQVTALGAGPDGEIVVADGASQELRVFDAAGAHLRTLGKKGGGPGEFEGIAGMAWDDHGVLWVADPGNARYARYDRDGTYLGDVRTSTPGAVLPWHGALGRDGFLYDAAVRVVGDRREFRYYRLDRGSGAIVDTFPPMVYVTPPLRGMPQALFRLTPRLTFRISPEDVVWFGETDAYRLIVRTLGGDTLRIVELDRPRVRVSAAERDSIVRAVRREPPTPGAVFDPKDIPEEKPAFDRIHFDDGGHVVVEPDGPPADAGRVFDVFDRDGRFLGQARSDVAFETFPALPVFAGGFVYGVATEASGIQVIVRARIVVGRP